MTASLTPLVQQLRRLVTPRAPDSDAELVQRFAGQRDEAAFAALVERHGRMVLGVCRRVLLDEQAAEDAFQATFLVLARRAGALGRPEAVAGWLYRVAHLVARKARGSLGRRRAQELPVEVPEARPDPLAELSVRELLGIVDEELLRLPERYRLPVLLCCLENKSQEEAARQLGWTPGSVKGRLERGRKRLHQRLARRGIVPTAGLAALEVASGAARAQLPASGMILGAASVPAEVLELAEAVLQGMSLARWKVLMLMLVLAGSLAGVSALAFYSAGEQPPAAGPQAGADKVEPQDARRSEAVIIGKVVDEAGKSVAGATVLAPNQEKSRPVTSGADGAFRLALGIPAPEGIYATLLVRGPDNRLGVAAVAQKKPEPVRVVLKAPQPLAVQVQGSDDKPVAGAEVYFLWNWSVLGQGRTDADGRWTGRVPADTPNWEVFARKAQVGCEFAVAQSGRGSSAAPRPLPEQLILTLDGARTVRVKTVDRDGKPLPGVKVGPSSLWNYIREQRVNLPDTSDLWPTTGPDGSVVFDWLPKRQLNSVLFQARVEGHYPLEQTVSWLTQDKSPPELIISMLPTERLSGLVRHADGQPAADIQVTAAGAGAGGNGFRGSTRTAADGRYTLQVHAEQAYVVAVSDERWGAPYRSDVIVHAGKPVTGIDFVLGRATRVHGRVTVGKEDRPATKMSVHAVIDRGEIPAELRRREDTVYRDLSMTIWAEVDRDGCFEFHLGPGEYQLQGPPRVKPVKVTIPATHPPAEIVCDLHMPRPETGPLVGGVVDGQGQPVAGGGVQGQYASSEAHRMFRALKTDAQGRFRVERSLDALVLFAQTADKTRAGVTRLSAEAAEAEIRVGSVASASGRLLDPAGKPLPRLQVWYGIHVYLGEPGNSPHMTSFGGRVTTDAEGRFTITGLVPGETYHLNLDLDRNDFPRVTEVEPKGAAAIDLGDLRVDPTAPKPYVPPTPAEQTKAAFTPAKASPRERLTRTLAEARRMYTRPLLLFGRPSDPACVELYRLFGEEAEGTSPQQLRWEFELTALDTEQPDVKALAAELGVEVNKGPLLAILGADGARMASHALQLDGKQKLDGPALTAFLARHKLPTRDAEVLLAEALEKAKTEAKRVYFIASASWCGPCRRLARFLEAHAGELERHYVFVKLDISRDTHAEAVCKRYQGNEHNGVPWHAVLDAEGKLLITSNAPGPKSPHDSTNIGFPSGAAEVAHFLRMLQQTAPRLTEARLAELRKVLSGSR